MAGSISLSLSQQFDSSGRPLNGGKLYTYAAGTTTPQSAYRDTGLTSALPNPIIMDAAGRLPQMFFADGNIKVLIVDTNGITQLAADNVLVIGASSGGGGGAAVDPTTVFQTAQLVVWYSSGAQAGFVRANGRTIGNASSGATERANADTAALWTFLYLSDPTLAVSGGRTGDVAVDYAANKTIALPDFRGRALAGLDDMGNSAAGRLTLTYFGASGTQLGAAGGTESQTLSLAQLPTGITSANASQSISVTSANALVDASGSLQDFNPVTASGFRTPNNTASLRTQTSSGNNSIAVTSNNTGGGAHPIASPMMLVTVYIKL